MDAPKTVFRNYDIRGIYPDEINENFSFHLGRALGTLISGKDIKNVVLGRDDRESSPIISNALIKGMIQSGCRITDIGITLTPVIHFLTVTENYDLGIVVTASHNPKEFNGFRIDLKGAKPFYGDEILSLRFIIEREEYKNGDGYVVSTDLSQRYINFLKNKFMFKKRFRVVVDCGSGASSILAPVIFETLGCDVIPVYCEYDGKFPHGVPDPENSIFMGELQNLVLKNKADVGFAYDTDGDRFGAVDDKGVAYATDRIFLPFIDDVLKKHPGASVAFDVKSSSLVDQIIKKAGGVSKVLRTGHPYFMKEVETNSLIGAEFAGHVYFSDNYFGYDDGIYASCRVLQLMDEMNKNLSDIMSVYPKRISTNEIKVNCPDDLKFKVINIIKIYIMNFVDYKGISDIDGVRVTISDTGWFLIRASNTAPYLSIRAEGKDKDELQFLIKTIEEALDSVDVYKLNLENSDKILELV